MEGAGEKWKILNFGRTEREDGSMRPMSGRCRHRGNSECWRYVRRKRGWYLREERSTRSIREGLAVPDQGEPRRPPTRPNLHIIPSRLTYTYPSTRPSSCLAHSLSFFPPRFPDRPPCAPLPVISLNRRCAMNERNHGPEIDVQNA